MNTFANLNGHSAVITGASSGIGRAIALEFARGGATTLVTCRNSIKRLDETVAEIGRTGADVSAFVGDLADAQTCRQLVDTAWRRHGEISIWVNNCGADVLTGPAAKLSYQEKLDVLLDVDLQATIRLSRLAGARMREAGRGVILNVGWDQADRGMDGESGELFAAVKNAIMGFTRSLSLSLAPEVRVNCLAPGWIKTAWGETVSDYWQQRVLDETPLKRWGTPQDIANTARFLCSDEAGFITGQVINVNGGAVR